MSKTRVLALIDSDPVLKAICLRMDSRKDKAREQMKFLKKQIEDLQAKVHAENEPDWKMLRDHLTERGQMVNYDPRTMHIICSVRENSITLCDHEGDAVGEGEHPLAAILGRLFGGGDEY